MEKQELEKVSDALSSIVYDSDMKHNRWRLWTAAKEALSLVSVDKEKAAIDWKLKAMQILDAVVEAEAYMFDPWPGITEEEEAEIKREHKTYRLEDRPGAPTG